MMRTQNGICLGKTTLKLKPERTADIRAVYVIGQGSKGEKVSEKGFSELSTGKVPCAFKE